MECHCQEYDNVPSCIQSFVTESVPHRRPAPGRHPLPESFDSFNLVDMKSMTANEAKTRFGEFIDIAQREPVRVLRHDRVVGVMVSPNDYEKMREWYADRLIRTMDAVADKAAALGLTEAGIDDLLRDES